MQNADPRVIHSLGPNALSVARGAVADGAVADGRALQDRLRVHCFGCGSLHPQGLHVKSHWVADELVCVWQPRPEHIGFPGCVYGGVMASVVDCHCIWAALSMHCQDAGHDLDSGPPPFHVVTASLRVDYLEPASVARALELRARVVEHQGRKSVVDCIVHQGPTTCATAKVIAVRVAAVG